MARIFISYNRVDKIFVQELVALLRRMYNPNDVWFDEALHGGDLWWEEILKQIALADIFIYILSNESVQSPYCQAEFTEARRLQRAVITVQARDRTKLTDELKDIHYINMTKGVTDGDALTNLYRSIDKKSQNFKRKSPLWSTPTPKPINVEEKVRAENAPQIETPQLMIPKAEREAPPLIPWWKDTRFIIVSISVPILIGLMMLGVTATESERQTQAFEATETAAQEALDRYATPTAIASITPTQDVSLPTPTSLEVVFSVASFRIVSASGEEIGIGTVRAYYEDAVAYGQTTRVELELTFDYLYITPTPRGPRTPVAVTPRPTTASIRPSPTPRLPVAEQPDIGIYQRMGATLTCAPTSFVGCDGGLDPQSAKFISFNGGEWLWILAPQNGINGLQALNLELWTVNLINDTVEQANVVWSHDLMINVTVNQPAFAWFTDNLAVFIPALSGLLIAMVGGVFAYLNSRTKPSASPPEPTKPT